MGLRRPRVRARPGQGPPKSHPRPLRTAQEPPKSHPRPLRAPTGPQKARNHAKTMQKPLFLQGFVKTRVRRPKAAQDAPKEAQEAARTAPERPGAAQGRAKRDPRAAKSDPKGRPGSPRTGQGVAQERERPWRALEPQSPKTALRRPKMGPKRGPGEAQVEQRSQDKKIQVETRQQKTRPEARRDSKLTKGLPEPVSPEPLSPYPTYFSCI